VAKVVQPHRDVTIQQTFDEALEHRMAGREAEAGTFLRRAMDSANSDAEMLRELGAKALEVGWNEAAAAFFGRAADLDPESATTHANLGRACTALGRLDEAITACAKAIQLQPNLAEAHNQLGVALGAQGRLEEAVAAFQKAVKLRPGYAVAHNNLGIALRTMGRLDDAAAAYRRAIRIQPDYIEAINDLGNILETLGRSDEAIAAFRQAILAAPGDADLHNNLGIALREKGRIEEAVGSYSRAIALDPRHAEAHHNLGNALGQLGRLGDAQAACIRALEINPQDAQAKFLSGTLHLLAGEFSLGWPRYEERWDIPEATSPRRDFAQPVWDGSALEGRRVLIHEEQGFGDAIQFIRYAPLVADRGGQVILECSGSLAEVFSTVKGVGQIVVAGEPLPPFDIHIPMMSLPLTFGTTVESIPQNVPYISADAARCEFWRAWLAENDSILKVGIVWGGRTDTTQRSLRSVRLRDWLPIFRVPDVDFVSLQVGRGIEQIKQLPGRQPVRDASCHIEDFADTAALVSQLDLVIAVDTAVAHLAGALGKPVWVLLPFAPDWRWMLGREDSPWYPSMRLFRQQRALEWEPVISRVRKELQTLVEARA
jgi:tetratricopeptide (TPR) repeat protein